MEYPAQNTQQHMPRAVLIGTGDAGLHHAQALVTLGQEGQLQWAGSVARDQSTYQDFCARADAPNAPTRYNSVDQLLDAHTATPKGLFDIAIIATPDALHHQHIMRCLGAGIAVLAEKPLVTTVDQAQECDATAQNNNVLLRAGYQHRFHAGHLALKQLMADPDTIEHIELSWAWPDPNRSGWRANKNSSQSWAIAALGTHLIDFAMWLTDKQMTSVSATLQPHDGPEQSADIVGLLGKNTSVHISTSVNERQASKVLVYGKKQFVSCIGTFGARGSGVITVTNTCQQSANVAFTPQNPYTAQLRAFAGDYTAGYQQHDSLIANVAILQDIQNNRPVYTRSV
jgi:predicted dehydrogenase